jgi:hypothetical protein
MNILIKFPYSLLNIVQSYTLYVYYYTMPHCSPIIFIQSGR